MNYKERPILFSGPMVRAILEGRKTQTRRVVKPQPAHVDGLGTVLSIDTITGRSCPYGKPGWTKLWVRETWGFSARVTTDAHRRFMAEQDTRFLIYKATADHEAAPWKPSIHMPRWASRITLEVVSVRVERLQDISEEDAVAEGVTPQVYQAVHTRASMREETARQAFEILWESINGPGSWDANPFVWVVEFRRVK